MFIIRDQKGFSFVETILYVAIVGAAVVGFVTFIISITNTRNKNFVVQEVQSNGRVAIDIMSQKIRAADYALNPSSGNTSTTLELVMPGGADNLVFTVNQGRLFLIEGGATSTPLTTENVRISSISFSNLAAPGERDNINIEITTEYGMTDIQSVDFIYSQDLQTSVVVRN
ncbi:MAG: hypothetical protein GF349_03550 [Candidatus Magasanikbacteria bacterium]|nr:hypothetical protein [Candidatus Magasanikbacteria bacterium]